MGTFTVRRDLSTSCAFVHFEIESSDIKKAEPGREQVRPGSGVSDFITLFFVAAPRENDEFSTETLFILSEVCDVRASE